MIQGRSWALVLGDSAGLSRGLAPGRNSKGGCETELRGVQSHPRRAAWSALAFLGCGPVPLGIGRDEAVQG